MTGIMKQLKLFATSLLLLLSVGAYAEIVTVNATDFKPGGTVDISVSLENSGTVSGYAMKFVLPDGFSLLNKAKGNGYVCELSDRHGKHYSMSQKKASDGSYLFVVYSSKSGDVIKNHSGLLFTTKLSVASTVTMSQQARLESIAISDADGIETALDDVTFDLVKIPTITVTAKSYSRQYGEPNPDFEYVTKGGSLGGTPIVTCKATANSPVGVYDIVVAEGGVNSPYVTYVNGTLTITKAPLKIKAGTYTKNLGEDNPEFKLEYEGFVNGETETVLTKKPTVTCKATKESAVGEYPVSVSGAEAQNYEISYVNGTLSVETILGDANGDGVVNAADIVAVIRYKKGNAPAGFVFKAADVNKDGNIDELDVKAIESIILKR